MVEGDATNDDVLRAAGVERARGLITTIDSDAHNVYVTLSARALNPALFVVARANQEGAEAKLLQAGASRVVSPYTRAGRQIAELAIRPRVADFIDSALSHGELAFSLEEIEVAAGGPLDGRTVGSLRDDGHLRARDRPRRARLRAEPADRPRPVAGREPHRLRHGGDPPRAARPGLTRRAGRPRGRTAPRATRPRRSRPR